MSHERLAIGSGELRAVVLPGLGAGLAEVTFRRAGQDVPVLRSWNGTSTNPSTFASFLLIPWSNRIAGGGITVDGRFYPIAPNREGSALPIHGEGFQAAWQVLAAEPDRVRLGFASSATPPWDYRAEALYETAGATLTMRLSLEHRADHRAPYGLGFHPWFPRTAGTRLTAPAERVWHEDEEHLPTECVPVAQEPDWDFAQARGLPPGRINNAFCGWNGVALITWPELALELQLAASPLLSTYILYSLGAEAGFFCLEPVSHPVNAFHLPGGPEAHGLRLLGRGQTLEAAVQLTVREP